MEHPGGAAEAPPPRTNPDLLGHDEVERELLLLWQISRLPHAILFCGPRGIGKATLAFRLARFALARGAGAAVGSLAIDTGSGVFCRVAAGGHADLCTVERIWDAQRRRFRAEITAEQTRGIADFLHLTAAEEGWRVVIVDGAEEMNRSAANALLKILEEPPHLSLLALVSHNPGRLPPTIRSRCRRFRLVALAAPVITALLGRYRPGLNQAEATVLTRLAGGSIGRAIDIADAGGLGLYRTVIGVLSQAPRLDIPRLHGFVDGLVAAEAEAAYRIVGELLSQWVARIATVSLRSRLDAGTDLPGEAEAIARLAAAADPARWAKLRAVIDENFASVRDLNLDRKQAMLGTFFAIADAAR
jgi:DNA polymerase-3 subunit delta'